MAINQEIVDRYVAHRLWLMRYEQRVSRDVLEVLRRGEEQAIGGIISAYESALAAAEKRDELLLEWDGYGIGFRRKALSRARAALDDVFPEARKSLRRALEGVADEEQEAFLESIEGMLPKPAIDELALSRVPEQQIATMLDSRFGAGLEGSAKMVFDDMADLEETALRRLNHAIQDGVRDGVGTRRMVQIAKKVVGTDGMLGRDVAAYVRTAVQAAANDTAGQIYRENSDIIRAEQYVATLDKDTCAICGPLDGVVFRFDKNGGSTIPRPPRHSNCRCFVTPVVDDWKAMGLGEDTPKELKRLLDGKPAPRTTWSEWVTRNDSRLKESLGPKRAAMIQSGKYKLTDFSDDEATEALNLGQIRGKRRQREKRAA